MRIIAGKYRSLKLETLDGNMTRPTLDKVKEAVFSSLGGMFDGGVMLDLYSGSGAIGLEAISRGFDHAYLVDQSFKATQIIHKNISHLHCESQTTVLTMKDVKAIEFLASQNIRFTHVYLDPPYAKQKHLTILELLHTHQLLKDNAIIIIESNKEETYDFNSENYTTYKTAVYGIMKITYIRHKNH